jgi:hypothetical protein
MTIHTTPPPNWEKLAASFGNKNVPWAGPIVVTYGGKIYSPSGKVDPDVLVHEMVHVAQQQGKTNAEMEAMSDRYISDPEYVREMETPAFKAQVAFMEATIKDPAELWCRKYTFVKGMVKNYNGAFTMESASAIMNIQ